MALAHPGYAQKVLDKELTISLRDITIENALHEIEVAANVKFIYSPERLKLDETISLKVEKKKLGDVLYDLLTPRGIEFIGDNKSDFVTLRPIKKKETEKDGKKTSSVESNRERSPNSAEVGYATITGVVTDGSTNLPLPGVNVIVKGTTNGTSTDSEGYYTISAEDNDILIFSFIGFSTQEIQISGRNIIDVILNEDAARLNEVLVKAGYWEVKDKERTGNISRITKETISKQPVSNPLAAMIGRMPGVQITQTTGVPGGGFSVQVRGLNSLRSDANKPLYVVDGVPFTSTAISTDSQILPGGASPLNNINPLDIESIEVLKDADATAIYGSRGSNGVILITTKKASSSQTKVDVNLYTGFGKVPRFMNLLNTAQYTEMRREAFHNDNRAITFATAPDLLQWDTTRYTNWQKKLIGGTANVSNAQISVSGGNSNTQFVLTAGVYKETTVFPGNFGDLKTSMHLNLNHNSQNQKFNVQLMTSFVDDNNKLLRNDLTSQALQLPPNAPETHLEDGNLNWQNSTWANPYAELLKEYQLRTSNLISNVIFSYQLVNALKIKTNLGYTTIAINEVDLQPIRSQNPAIDPTGVSTYSNGRIDTWIIEPQAELNKNLGQGKLNAIIGGTIQQSITDTKSILGRGYTSDALLENLQAAPTVRVLSSNNTMYRYIAAFARINYIWRSKYILNLTGRRDGSSRFGNGQQFANFGAIGAAWLFSEEKLFEDNLSFLDFGKLRASFGTTGSDQIPDYGYLDSYSATTYPYDGSGLVPTRHVNPDFAWEINRKSELGLEIGLVGSRVLINTSWYRNISSNQLVGYPLPALTGQTSVQANLPATVQNTGWEIDFETHNVRGNNFEWTTNFNLTVPRNKLVEYPNLVGSSYSNIYVVGQPLSISKAYQPLGVNPETGAYIYADVNNDNAITDPSDRQTILDLGQKFYGGLSNSIRLGNWELEIFFQFVNQKGKNYFNATNFGVPGTMTNQPDYVMDRWQDVGDISSVQGFTTRTGSVLGQAYQVARFSEYSITDASYLRLKNVSLSYRLSSNLLHKMNLKSMRVYVQGQNVITMTNYEGMDPENQRFASLPALRMLTIGGQFTF